MTDDRPIGLDIFRTCLPMRGFEHAAASRAEAEAIVLRLRMESGAIGWGEALPREYVTGETLETVVQDVEQIFWPLLKACRDCEELRQAVIDLPCQHEGRNVPAARCAVELAAAQAVELDWGVNKNPHPASLKLRRAGPALQATLSRKRERGSSHGAQGKFIVNSSVRISGVIGSANPRKTARQLRLMRWYGLKSFKLKLGFDEKVDQENLRIVTKKLKKPLAAGKCSLRVDINGAWKYGDVPARAAELKKLGVLAVEQPCKCSPGRLAELAFKCELPLIADESCITERDAEVLLGAEGRVWLNIRLGKNGGIGPSLKLARLCQQDELPYILGCMVGESGLLSTAQRVFLRAAPPPVLVEGNYGPFLLKDDLTSPSPRFGYAGRLMLPYEAVYRPQVRAEKLANHAALIRALA